MTARDEVLARIRAALGPGVAVPEVPRDYRAAGTVTGDPVRLFCERAAEYRANVTRVPAAELAGTVRELCRGKRIAVPPGGPDVLSGVEVVVDDPPLTPQALDGLDGVLTGCALAIAETGTIVLDGGERSGRRALTLVPDWHLCVVAAERIVQLVPEAVERLQPALDEGRPLTFISGPSATSDIELNRVEGVHGPRTLHVVIVEPA
jgi:L-lactate dehydrogenase complex protein LldG